jgi:hypothetical protein
LLYLPLQSRSIIAIAYDEIGQVRKLTRNFWDHFDHLINAFVPLSCRESRDGQEHSSAEDAISL